MYLALLSVALFFLVGITRRFKGNFNDVYWQGLSRNLTHLENMVEESKIDELGILDKQQLIRAMGQHANGIGDVKNGSRISTSLAAIAWYARIKNVLNTITY